jgi:hypothetical protein
MSFQQLTLFIQFTYELNRIKLSQNNRSIDVNDFITASCLPSSHIFQLTRLNLSFLRYPIVFSFHWYGC